MRFWNSQKSTGQSAEPPLPNEEQEQGLPDLNQPARVPKTEPKRQRSETLKLRLSPGEKALIEERALAAEMSKTDFIMTAVKGSRVIVIDGVPALLMELRRQGNNLNQAVKLAHQNQSTELPEIKAAIKQCTEAQNIVVDFCKKWDVKLRKKAAPKENGYGNRNN